MVESFGKYLRARRVAADLSLRDVASRLGVSHVYLGEVERAVRPPLKRDRWQALVDAIPGVTIDELERAAATSRPIQLHVEYAPLQYQDLALALARRIDNRDLDCTEISGLLAILARKV